MPAAKAATRPAGKKAAPAAKRDTGRQRDPASSGKDIAAYRAKRDFEATPEPAPGADAGEGGRFCVQKHDATRLHYDLRLELDGVLKSWAVTRGPSLVPGDKRLAVHTEDHPLEYLAFEGVIPEGQYGAGTMIVWDRGRWTPEGDVHKAYAKGHLAFTLDGERLHGSWHLVRMRARPGEKKENWLLLKVEDEAARTADDPDVLDDGMSVLSGRTNADLEKEGATRIDHARRAEAVGRRERTLPDPAKAKKSKKGILPPFVEPSLAASAAAPPGGESWVHEIKYDGYRLLARIEGRQVQLLTRSGLDWTAKFPTVAAALADLDLGAALIDGEVVAEDDAGASSFSGLQAALKSGDASRLRFYAFDLLHLDGRDLRPARLLDRKALLAAAFESVTGDGVLRYSEHLEADATSLLAHACRLGLEGVVSKRKDAPYLSGRGDHWVKSKCADRQEFVVIGYVPSTTGQAAIGSLVLAVNDGDGLVHAGRAGSGYTAATARELKTTLDPHRRQTPPVRAKLPREATKDVRWTEPVLVAEVEFRGWTADGLVRQAAFKGLRDDKDPAEIVRENTTASTPKEKAAPAAPLVRLTHPDRVLWQDAGITKQGLADFYTGIARWILPHVANRPLSLVRCPGGTAEKCFFQKHAWAGVDPKLVTTVTLGGDEGLAIRDLAGLHALVQAGVLEIHPWGATVDDPERPDRITMDLDPGDGVPWERVVEAAFEVRERLAAMKLESFVKTTGGKGLHVVVPLTPDAGWDAVKGFAQALAGAMARDAPAAYVDTIPKKVRQGKILVDYLRNGRGATAVAAYSTRARAGAPVSTPIGWDELRDLRSGNQYDVENLAGRLDHLPSDPWEALAKARQKLPAGAPTKPVRRRAKG